MQELASIADQPGVNFADLRQLAAEYGVEDAKAAEHSQPYYSIRSVRRVIQAFVVMSWDKGNRRWRLREPGP